MIKKIFIIFLLFFSGFSFVLAWPKEDYEKAQKAYEQAVKNYWEQYRNARSNLYQQKAEELKKSADKGKIIREIEEQAQKNASLAKDAVKKTHTDYIKAKSAYDNSDASKDDFTSPWFKIPVNQLFPWSRYWKQDNYVWNIKEFFMDIIQKLMIGLGAIALIIIVIWASFMILYHGEESMITKWKSIFSWWIIALVVALSAYYLVEIVKYLLALT